VTREFLAINPWGETVAFLVDDEDAPNVEGYIWRTTPQGHVYRNGSAYGGRRGARHKTTIRIYLHRQLMGLRRGHRRVVDHLNNNPLDNRRQNMEVVRKATNEKRGTHGLLPTAVVVQIQAVPA